jgi:hypothetical protein
LETRTALPQVQALLDRPVKPDDAGNKIRPCEMGHREGVCRCFARDAAKAIVAFYEAYLKKPHD